MYILKSSASPQKPKPKENHSLSHQNKTTRKQIQGLNLETGREKKRYITQRGKCIRMYLDLLPE